MLKSLIRRVAEWLAPTLLYARDLRRMSAREVETRLLPALCRAGCVAVDIGANRGLYVHHLRPLASRVVAFEPLSAMQRVLRRYYGTTIDIQPVALSDSVGTANLRVPAGNFSWASIATSNTFSLTPSGSRIEVLQVSMRTLDSYELRNVGFVKIDVEGHEEAVLRGALETIRRERPNLLIEIEERHAPGAVHRIMGMLAKLGYEGFYVDGPEIKPFSRFDLDQDQPVANVSEKGKTGKYINNFIFVPSDHAGKLVEAMHILLTQNAQVASRSPVTREAA
jgi:FkbM family methyltransferase